MRPATLTNILTNYWVRGSGGVKSAAVSQSVRETGRDESQSVPSPEKHFETRDLELLIFEGTLPSCSPHSAGYYEARNDYTNNSETVLLCNRCVCNWKIKSRQLMCVIGAFTENTFTGARITQSNSCQKQCVTDILCNWDINSQIIKICVCVQSFWAP